MAKRPYPLCKSVLPDQTPLVKKLYTIWDNLAVEIEILNKIIKSSAFKRFSLKKKILIRLQRFYMKRYFACIDKQILIEVLNK